MQDQRQSLTVFMGITNNYYRTVMISIVVPTLNEADNIPVLIDRLSKSFQNTHIEYEIIFIDDHSTDNSVEVIDSFVSTHPIKYFLKRNQKGKAQSLIEGFSQAQYPVICMIDADLQYPPEAIIPMYKQIQQGRADILVAARTDHQTSRLRQFFSKGFRTIFGKYLHNLDYDVQSGLKVFRTEIIERIQIQPSPWTFDLEFLLKARQANYQIGSYEIAFAERVAGEAKVNVIRSGLEIGWRAIKQKFTQPDQIWFSAKQQKMLGLGFDFNQKRYIPYTQLHHRETALYRLTRIQRWVISFMVVGLISSLFLNWIITLQVLIALLTTFYLIDLLFNGFLAYRSLNWPPEIDIEQVEIETFPKEWPTYSILCPLYKEAHVLPQFIEAMSQLDYPSQKLEILLLLEEDDQPTIQAARSMELPTNFRIVVTPDAQPKTKPKACNFGLTQAKGEFVVIYDAEDVPDPLQLKKAVVAFNKLNDEVACIQAKLNYYNPTQNWLTRLFTLEYSLWFGLTLPGLQSVKAPIPLGGTSNHFRTKNLIELNGWDAFNVTEDADLGMRLFKRGYLTAVINSFTMEEANSHFWNWIRQRSRWIKGYMQTYLVHMRQPGDFIRQGKALHLLTFQLTIGGKILSMLINPFLWLTTILYFAFSQQVEPILDLLLLPWVFYLGTISLIIGNFFYIYLYMIGVAKRKKWGLVKYAYFVPLYWLMMSWAALFALYELFVRPHHWQKTNHGLHLNASKSKSKKSFRLTFKPSLPINFGYLYNYRSDKS